MLKTGAKLGNWTWCIATLAITLAIVNTASAIDKGYSSSADCSAREVLIFGLLESQAAASNAVSEKLVAESSVIMQAQTACENGRVRDGLALYDRFLSELAEATPQRDE